MTRLEKIIQCILSIKLSAPQIFLFDGQAWKHDPMHTAITAIIIWLCKKYFLFSGLTCKCFCRVYYQSQVHSKYFSLMVWLESIISWRLSVTTILVAQASYTWVKIFCFMDLLENILQFILSGKPVWWSDSKSTILWGSSVTAIINLN